jgi:hypothetical protein
VVALSQPELLVYSPSPAHCNRVVSADLDPETYGLSEADMDAPVDAAGAGARMFELYLLSSVQ